MMNFVKRGIEFNRVAKSFEAMFEIINVLQPVLERSTDDIPQFKRRFKTDILMLACIAKKGIVDRLDENNWGLEWKIMIPAISHSRVTIGYAWSQTITKAIIMSTLLEMDEEWEEINNGGPLCQEIENIIPAKYKNW